MKCRWYAVLFALPLMVGCGDDDGDNNPLGPGDPGTSSMSATIDGESWSAVSISIIRQAGAFAIGGTSADAVALGVAFPDTGTGDYSIGPQGTASATLISQAGSWIADPTHGGGMITITILTATRAAGTFSYTADATAAGTTPATRAVTNGSFDLAIP